MALSYIEYYTYKDYKHWEGDWELIAGTAYAMSPSPMKRHQALSAKIAAELIKDMQECLECDVLIEQDYKIDEFTVLRPDVAVVCNDPKEEYIAKAPEIVVEVISLATAKRDETIKFELYEKEGVKYYILVYPEDLRAKVFKNRDSGFKKIGDFFSEQCCFEDIACKPCIDFGRVFRKWRETEQKRD